MQLNMVSAGFTGTDMPNFADAVSNGTVPGLVGAPFTTSDTGTIPGAGTGTGTGVIGVIEGALSISLYLAFVSAFGSSGPNLPDLADAMAAGLVSELANATLTSTHGPVYVGSGTIAPGGITVAGATIASAITFAGVGFGFLGLSWPDAADVIGNEYANAITTFGSGVVTITGSPTGPTSPGVGVGAGTLS